jgi:hypothetical protein
MIVKLPTGFAETHIKTRSNLANSHLLLVLNRLLVAMEVIHTGLKKMASHSVAVRPPPLSPPLSSGRAILTRIDHLSEIMRLRIPMVSGKINKLILTARVIAVVAAIVVAVARKGRQIDHSSSRTALQHQS